MGVALGDEPSWADMSLVAGAGEPLWVCVLDVAHAGRGRQACAVMGEEESRRRRIPFLRDERRGRVKCNKHDMLVFHMSTVTKQYELTVNRKST